MRKALLPVVAAVLLLAPSTPSSLFTACPGERPDGRQSCARPYNKPPSANTPQLAPLAGAGASTGS